MDFDTYIVGVVAAAASMVNIVADVVAVKNVVGLRIEPVL